MTAKSFLRFLIGYVIAAVLMGIGLPYVGIPRAQLLPPALAYGGAHGHATGVITGRRTPPTSNPFHVGDVIYLVDYQFVAPAPRILGTKGNGVTKRAYSGYVNVSEEAYNSVKKGQEVSVKYETTYPDISGIVLPGFGRSGAPGSTILSAWWGWLALALVLGYFIAPLLERLMLRESY